MPTASGSAFALLQNETATGKTATFAEGATDMEHEAQQHTCISCNRDLTRHRGILICLHCNPEAIDTNDIFIEAIETDEHVFIECPGVTIYDSETGEIVEGVRWRDENDATRGYEVIGRQIYAPNHKHRRRIKKDAVGRIRRCQACQDYTIRMRRPEGRDFYIPSVHHRGRTKLRPMEHVTYEPK